MRACQTSKKRKATVLEQRNPIYIDLDSNCAGFRTTAVENGVEVTHEEKKFSENEKTSRAKSKNRKRLPELQQEGRQAVRTAPRDNSCAL